MAKLRNVAVLVASPTGDMDLIIRAIPLDAGKTGNIEDALDESGLSKDLVGRGFTIQGAFGMDSPAWLAVTRQSPLGELPDPVTAGWLASLSDLYHKVKGSDDQHRDHQMRKIRELQDFLCRVDAAKHHQAGPMPATAPSPQDMAFAVCDIAQVDFHYKQGSWEWSTHDHFAKITSHSPGEAAMDAATVLFPKNEWKYRVENGDTERGYWDWAIDAAIHYAEEHRLREQQSVNPSAQ